MLLFLNEPRLARDRLHKQNPLTAVGERLRELDGGAIVNVTVDEAVGTEFEHLPLHIEGSQRDDDGGAVKTIRVKRARCPWVLVPDSAVGRKLLRRLAGGGYVSTVPWRASVLRYGLGADRFQIPDAN